MHHIYPGYVQSLTTKKMLMLPCMPKIHLVLITNLTRYIFFVTLYLYTLHCSIDNAYNNKLHPFIYTFLPIFPSLSIYLQKQKFVHQRSLHVKVPTVNAYHSHGCATWIGTVLMVLMKLNAVSTTFFLLYIFLFTFCSYTWK